MLKNTAPKGGSVTQTNTSISKQISRSVNTDSPDTSSVTSNMISINQSNLQIGSMDTGLYFGIIQTNSSTAEQFALAVNYGSSGARASATNSNTTVQTNNLTTSDVVHGGKVIHANDNFTVQVDLALNYNSPGATATATNSIVIEQV